MSTWKSSVSNIIAHMLNNTIKFKNYKYVHYQEATAQVQHTFQKSAL